MPQSISPDIKRICAVCGQEFHPHARKQYCCNEIKVRQCVICGEDFEVKCCKELADKCICSKKECVAKYATQKRMQAAGKLKRTCKYCGKEFSPRTFQQVYCDSAHYSTCVVCGKEFEVNVQERSIPQTCSDKCRYELMVSKQDKEAMAQHLRESLLEKYGVTNSRFIEGVEDKMKQTSMERYGTEWYTQTEEYRKKIQQTCQEKYGVDHHLQAPEVIDKRIATVQEKYGARNIFSSDYGKKRVRESMLEKYGVENPSQHPEFKSKSTRNSRNSKLEERICKLLDNYHIDYIHHYFIKNEECSHEFDFFVPKYKLLIDADGVYFHSYLSDPDGVRVRDDYDEIRLNLIPENYIFHVIVETEEDRQVKEIIELLESLGENLKLYDSKLFEWCRSIGFPYPAYSEERMLYDWEHLKSYTNDTYVAQCRIGISLVKNFHRSIYSCKVGNSASPLEGWYNDDKLKQVIRNRFIYKNDVDPSKILSGLNISKICPCVSMFNPILARYLVLKYLNGFEEVFDPFSGFSGRLLGTASCNKRYIGQDLNSTVVLESNQIIEFLGLQETCSVSELDTLESSGSYECLLTCPPYNKKEIYADETIFKSCDEWIDECLARFKCKRYVFIVDTTERYKKYVAEELNSISHLTKSTELVIVI